MSNLFDGIKVNRIEPVVKEGKTTHPHKFTHGDFTIQPTKGYTVKNKVKTFSDDPKAYNWAYCYFGIKSGGQHIAGFSLDNAKFMELVNIGTLPKAMGEAFVAFCEQYPELVQVKVG